MIDCRRPFSQAPWLLMKTSSVLRRPLAEYLIMLPTQCMLNIAERDVSLAYLIACSEFTRAHIPQSSMNTLYAASRPYERHNFSALMELVKAWHV